MVSRYSNEENGVLGQDEGMNNVFPINEADYLVEIMDEKGQRLSDGETGRIVVTDLFNYAMPMIRYDTGDVGKIEMNWLNGRWKRCISGFSGRKVDVIYDSAGNALSPHLVTNYMWTFPEVTQFQVIQKEQKEFELRLNVPKEFAKELEVVETLKEILGMDAQISVVKVDEIPVLASGKRRYIVNQWKS